MIDVAIVGAGPYGLSLGAYVRRRGISFRIFGRTMDSWLTHMPKGMLLKSDGFASNICDPEGEFTLKQFCAGRGVEYGETGVPVRLDTFCAYGLAFKERMLPELEEKLVSRVERLPGGFRIRLDDGDCFEARTVVLAVGITHFAYMPPALSGVPSELLSHSSCHHDLEEFRGRSVTVVGGGASALDLAGLLHEIGADVQLVSRRQELRFHSKPTGKPRSWWQQIRHPQSGLGPGLRSRFFANSPLAFHRLPERLRIEAVHRALGPSGGWFCRDMVMGRVPLLLGCVPEGVVVRSGSVHLQLRGPDGSRRETTSQHVIAATGYRVSMDRLALLSDQIRSTVRMVEGSPDLSSDFQCSVPGLYFAGVAAANSFGPVMRFAFGAGFAAKHLTTALAKSLARRQTAVAEPELVSAPK